jgi:hypothetical protein
MGENKSKRTNAFLGILLDNNPDCILVYRLKNSLLEYANPNAINVFGAQLNSRKPFSFFDDESRQNLRSLIELLKNSGNLDSFETSVVVQKKSGRKQATDVIGKTIFLESDIYLMLILPNIKNIFATPKNFQSNRMPAETVNQEPSFYQIANELIEPLRIVSTYIQLFEKQYGKNLDVSGKKILNYIVQGSQRLKHVIDDIHYYERQSYQPAPQSETP